MTRTALLLPCLLLLTHMVSAACLAAPRENPIDGDRAFGYLKSLCDLGPRPSGSPAMLKQQKRLAQHFQPLVEDIQAQAFLIKNPLGGPKVRITNLIFRWNPSAEQRLLVCAHYDTRPLPDQDPNPAARRSGKFLGANDGASGTAVLMELAHHADMFQGPLGVDFVLFDAEELVYSRRDKYFWGSTAFAQQYRLHSEGKPSKHPGGQYRWGVLLDMVGDADLEVYQEVNSTRWRDTRPLVLNLWSIAGRLGIKEFVPRTKHTVNDDHIPLHRIGGFPVCDIIDFDYTDAWGRNLWHTEGDVPSNCSGESLAKVGWVILEWLRSEQALAASPQ